MAEKTTIKEYLIEYKEFSNPTYHVEINGKKIDQKFTSNELLVEIPASYEASMCRFIIANGFNMSRKDKNCLVMEDNLKSIIKLGNKVEVNLGYFGAEDKTVFKGYIDTIYMDYSKDGDLEYIVECLDGKGLMMNSYHSETKKGFNKYSIAVEDVLKKYSSVISLESNSIDKSDAEIEYSIEQHNESDYDFVVRIARKLNYNFYIINGVAFFKSMTESEKNLMFKYDINEALLDFKMYSSIRNQVSSVTVRANNEKDPTKPIEGTVQKFKSMIDGSDASTSSIKLITDRVSRTYIDPSITSKEEATNRAQAILNEISLGIMEGYVKTPGIPSLIPGRVVSVAGFGEAYDKKYFVTKVIHKVVEGNYTTRCDLEVNEI